MTAQCQAAQRWRSRPCGALVLAMQTLMGGLPVRSPDASRRRGL